jgi:hypothetical protein
MPRPIPLVEPVTSADLFLRDIPFEMKGVTPRAKPIATAEACRKVGPWLSSASDTVPVHAASLRTLVLSLP